MIDSYTLLLCFLLVMFASMAICYSQLAAMKGWVRGIIFNLGNKENDYLYFAAFGSLLWSLYFLQKVNEWWTIFPVFVAGYVCGYVMTFILKNYAQATSLIGMVALFFIIPFEFDENTKHEYSLFRKSHKIGMSAVYSDMQMSERISIINEAISLGLEQDTLYWEKYSENFQLAYEDYFLTGLINIRDAYDKDDISKYEKGYLLFDKWKKWYDLNNSIIKESYLK